MSDKVDRTNYDSIRQACQNLIGACEDHSYEVKIVTLTREQALEQLETEIHRDEPLCIECDNASCSGDYICPAEEQRLSRGHLEAMLTND